MKIGFIAMSGVRAHDEKLTALGLTLPGFVDRNEVIAALPSLGLITLAGMTPDRFDQEYREVPEWNAADELPGDYDVVAISSFSAQIKEAYSLADRYRGAGTRVILGGLHVTALPQEALLHADSVVLGEGEIAWPKVVDDLQHGKLEPIYDARGCNFDMHDAPMPRFELLDVDRYNRLTVQTQRGCPFRCEFCAASIQLSPKYRVKPVAKVMEEIDEIKRIWPKPFIEFADDNTFVNKRHSKELMGALAKKDIRWFTETDISVADDDELLGLMRDSGCAQVLIGLESTSVAGLDGLELKTNWKAKRSDRYMEGIRRIQDHGITVNGCFILGLDGTGPQSFEAVERFVRESGLYEVQITVLTAFPGTPLYERLKREDRILRDGAWELCTLFDVNFQPERMSPEELSSGFRGLAERLYSDECTRARRQGFRWQRRARPLAHASPRRGVYRAS